MEKKKQNEQNSFGRNDECERKLWKELQNASSSVPDISTKAITSPGFDRKIKWKEKKRKKRGEKEVRLRVAKAEQPVHEAATTSPKEADIILINLREN